MNTHIEHISAMTRPEEAFSGATLMVVDDERWPLLVYERLLGDGYTVVSVESGGRAVAMAADLCPELIVLDLLGPDTDEMATLRALRQISLTAVIVVLAAIGTIQAARQAMLLGADDFITKPFDPDLLKLVLRDGLAARRRTAQELACAP
jgi:DNA-binding NtrC family response regulator